MDKRYTATLEQIKVLGRALESSGVTIEQKGDNFVVFTTYTDYRGSMSDGDSTQRKLVYEIRPDGKRRVIEKEESWEARKSWVRGTNLSQREKGWH